MILADTGFWLALANRRDAHHSAAVAFLQSVGEPLVTTWPVMTETCHLLLTRLGSAAMSSFMKGFEKGAFEVFDLRQQDASRLGQLISKYHDLPMDLADVSLVLLAEHLGEGRIVSTDQRDFHTCRWKNREPFQNLLLP